jgi:uncharacterized protein (DUF305 family)
MIQLVLGRNVMMKKTVCIGLTLAMLALPVVTRAEDDHANHNMAAVENATDGAAKAYMDGMAKMNRDMNAAMTGDADVDFAAMMIPHHQGAIAMAKVQLEYGKDPGLRKLSEAIVTAQESEITFLKGWLAKHSKPTDATHAHHMPSSMAYMEGMEKMNRDMNAAMTGDPDRDFVLMMIPHHQGAIDMAKVQLEHGKDPELHKLSGNIIKAQEGEIAFMKGWLAKP